MDLRAHLQKQWLYAVKKWCQTWYQLARPQNSDAKQYDPRVRRIHSMRQNGDIHTYGIMVADVLSGFCKGIPRDTHAGYVQLLGVLQLNCLWATHLQKADMTNLIVSFTIQVQNIWISCLFGPVGYYAEDGSLRIILYALLQISSTTNNE